MLVAGAAHCLANCMGVYRALLLLLAEYLSLDRQLDDLGQALDFLERKSDKLNQEARQLLSDAKAVRATGGTPEEATPGEMGGTPIEGEAELEATPGEMEVGGTPSEGKAENKDLNTPNSECNS